ncbi:response regulator [Clostridium bovifaecis]|uniref:Stage 0 sporulation protein A homolog n=1 Tax=Clostridium bovifaecis TaxID=2184719 RepID=A0A6I6EKI7_9CLOT|nr:response regulator [Clostridium bovifaecis]
MKKVLVINDCKFEEIIFRDLLKKLGYDVRISNEYEAIKQLEEFLPNIVIANLIMREITGDRLIKRIKSIKKDTWCVLSSSNPLSLENYKEFSVDEVMQTPISEEKFESALKFKELFKFCPYCGKRLESIKRRVIYCPNCGEKL